VTEKAKGKLGQWAGILTGLAALIGALVAAWTTVVVPALDAAEKQGSEQGQKLDGFYGLFRDRVEGQGDSIEDLRRQVHSLREALAELRSDLRDRRRLRSPTRRTEPERAPEAVAAPPPPPEAPASLPASLDVFVQQEAAEPPPGE